MKEKVEQFAKGEYNVDRPSVSISVDHLQLNIEAGSVHESTLEISTTNDQKIKGMVYDSRYLFKIEPHNFITRSQTVTLSFDARQMEKGERQSGIIYVVTDGGEFRIPYEIEIVSPTVETSIGELSDMFQFASLAESNWSEAVRMFTTSEFKRAFLAKEPMYVRVYDSLTRSLSASQAMEEFLTYTHKKRSISLEVSEKHIEFVHHEVPERLTTVVNRNTWGYMNASVSCDERWIQVLKRYISTEDFIGNKYQLEYMILPEFLASDNATGHIMIETVHQKLEIEVNVRSELAAKPTVKHFFTNDHIVKNHQASLVHHYLEFRTGKMELATYVEKTSFALRNLIQYCADDKLYRLGLIHMSILAGNQSQVEEEFKRIDADEDSMVIGNQESCYYAYLKALFYKDADRIEEAKKQIRYAYENLVRDQGELLFYFWLLLFLGNTSAEDKMEIFHEIEAIYMQGLRSPILYYEVCDILNHEPLMLKRLGGLEIASIMWGMRNHYISEDVIDISLDLAIREHGFDVHLFHLMQMIDQEYKKSEALKVICGMLIRTNQVSRKNHEYYKRAVDEGLKLIGVYEAYVRSMDMKNYDLIPEEVVRYLIYSNTLSEAEIAYVYADVIKNKSAYPALFGELAQTIENYMETQIVKGMIGEHLLVIYKEFLKPESINPKYAAKLPNIIFKRRILCSNPNIRSVIVSHKELDETEQVAFHDGVAYVDIITDSAIITLLDNKGNRYTSTVFYRIERLADVKVYLDTCLRFNPMDYRVLAYVYTQMGHKSLQDAKDVNQARDVLECKELSYGTRQQALLQILEYYLTNYDGEILEKYLMLIDLDYLDRSHSAEVISGYIMRGMNRKAYEAIKIFGYQNVEIAKLLRLASYIVNDTDILGDETLTSLCVYLYKKGQYNDHTIQYLVFYYKADTTELSRLWETAMVVLGEARELEENILAQSIFADADVDNAMDIFKSYYSGRHRTMVTKAFLKRLAYKYFIEEKWVSDTVFDYLMIEIASGEIRDDVCSCAMLYHLSKCMRLTDKEQVYVARAVKAFLNRGIVLPYFKAFLEFVDLPQEVFLKTYVVYKGASGQNVTLNYSIGSSELQTFDFKSCRMEERIPGYYVQEFIVFHGEQLLYHFGEEYTGNVALIESDSIKNDSVRSEAIGNRFECINQMLIYQEMRDDEYLTKNMEAYMSNQHVCEEILKLL